MTAATLALVALHARSLSPRPDAKHAEDAGPRGHGEDAGPVGVDVGCSVLLAAGNIMVYRVVLAEHLLGVILTYGRGPVAVASTLVVACCVASLVAGSLLRYGAERRPSRREAIASLGACCVTSLIVLAKVGLGVVHYESRLCECGE